MQDRYVVPELRLVGEADEIVLGNVAPGEDFLGQQIIGDLEFGGD